MSKLGSCGVRSHSCQICFLLCTLPPMQTLKPFSLHVAQESGFRSGNGCSPSLHSMTLIQGQDQGRCWISVC